MTGDFDVIQRTTQLENVALVRSGLVLARKDAKDVSAFRYPLINLKSILAEGVVDKETLDVFHSTEKLEGTYLTQTNDILVRLSSPYTAVLIDENTAGIVISSNFVVIRPDISRLCPAYLFWLVSMEDMKKRVYASATSNMLAAVKASFFSQLEIVIPSMNKQMHMGQLYLLARQESALLHRLADAKQQLCDVILKQRYQANCN